MCRREPGPSRTTAILARVGRCCWPSRCRRARSPALRNAGAARQWRRPSAIEQLLQPRRLGGPATRGRRTSTHTRHRQYGIGRPEADARTVEQRRRCRRRPVLPMEVYCPLEGRGQSPWYRCIAVDRCLPLGLGFNSALGQKRWNFALCEQRSQQPSETVLFLGSDDAPACFQEIHPSLAEVLLVHFVLLENVQTFE